MRRLVETALGALIGAGLALAMGVSAGSAPARQSVDWRVVGVVVEDAAGQRVVLPLAGVDAPLPAPSPTPPPTNTPRPTATGQAPTPTREATALPPITPRPTSEKGNCLAKLGGFAINERTAPRADAPRTPYGPIPAGSIVAVSEFVEAGGYLWAHDAFGWFVARAGENWWVTFVADTVEWCVELPGWPAGVEPPPPIVRALPGVWVGPGANRDELLQFGYQVQAAGHQPAATVYGEPATASLLLSRGWFVMLRAANVPDCPDTSQPASVSAERFASAVLDAVGTRAQVVVLANECAWPSAGYLREWIAAALQTVAKRGSRAVVPVVWNPGAPELSWVPLLASAYRNAPIAALWGMNIYPVRAATGLAVRDATTRYTTWRYELYSQHLRGVPMVATEFARADGSEPPQWEDIRLWWQNARNALAIATAWYMSGPGGLGHWTEANLAGKLRQLGVVLTS